MINRKPTNTKEEREKYCEHIPDFFHGSYRRLYDKAMGGKSLRAAVDSKCLDCMCWQQAEVRDCPVATCTLWPYRPYRNRATTQDSVSTQQHRRQGRFKKKSQSEGNLVKVGAIKS